MNMDCWVKCNECGTELLVSVDMMSIEEEKKYFCSECNKDVNIEFIETAAERFLGIK